MNGRPRGSGGQRSRSQEVEVVWKRGSHGGDIILNPLSRVDREMLLVKKGGGSVANSFNCTSRLSCMSC